MGNPKMPIFYKGAGPGTYLASNNPQLKGIQARDPSMNCTLLRMIHHIVHGTTNSPFISITSSPEVAADYACTGRTAIANKSNPGFVYEIEFDDPLPLGVKIVDPIKEVACDLSHPPDNVPYQHNGDMKFLLGIVAPTQMAQYRGVKTPSIAAKSGGTPHPPNLSDELQCLVRALRDAELLAVGVIPKANIVDCHVIT
jgi:hypothetical protein